MYKKNILNINNNSDGDGGECIKNIKQQQQPNDDDDNDNDNNVADTLKTKDYNIGDIMICTTQKTNNQITIKNDDENAKAAAAGIGTEAAGDTLNTKTEQQESSIINSSSTSSSNQLLFNQQRNRKRCYVSLAYSIGSMSLACGSLLQIPNTTDRITLQRGLFLTSLGFIYFISLTDFCNKYLLETSHGLKFRKKYSLMMSDVMEITNKIVSAMQASFSFLVGFIVCKSTCSKSFVYASHFLMEAYGWFGTAYFMYDIWSMYKVHTQKIADKLNLRRLTTATTTSTATTTNRRTKNTTINTNNSTTGTNIKSNGHYFNDNGSKGGEVDSHLSSINGAGIVNNNGNGQQHQDDDFYDYNGSCHQLPKEGRWDFVKYVFTHPVMMIHHVFIGTFGLIVVTYIRGGGHCIYSYMFMMEFSTPFVSLRSILSTMGLKESRAYIINGLGMLGAFLFFRVLMWPYVMWRYSIAIDATLIEALSSLPRGCIISILILFLPQLYWFYLMVKGALKVFFPSNKQQVKQTIPSPAVAATDTSTTKSNKNSQNDYEGNDISNTKPSPSSSESSLNKLKNIDKNCSTDSKPTATASIIQTTPTSSYILQKEEFLSQAALDETIQSSLPLSSSPLSSNGTNY